MKYPRSTHTQVKNGFLRWLLICCGWFFIAAGVVGIFLPLLPTVPFLLLAVACFARSSALFHTWLLEHNHMGPLLRTYLHDGRIPLRAKRMAIGMIWISFPASAFFFVQLVWVRIVLLTIAAGVTWYLLRLPTAPPAGKSKKQ